MLIIVLDITNTNLHCTKTKSRILQFFCYDYLEDLFASITFAKNFDFLAGIVSKIFVLKMRLQQTVRLIDIIVT